MQLLIGCGSSRDKRLSVNGAEWNGLVTLDHFEAHHPDILYDLEDIPLPFDDNSIEEIHAYEVLEHLGTQGDWRFFFDQWSDFWRILQPDGHFYATVPMPLSPWAWGDPSHRRVLPVECLTFLTQPAYDQVGQTPMSDFREIYKADFDIVHVSKSTDILQFALKAIKPSRIKS